MKFVCNNCGFTAEIPVRRTTCPMCGSSNVSASADTLSKPEKPLEEDDEKTGEIKTRNARSNENQSQRVTLMECQPPAKKGKKCCKKSCKCKILTLAVILILVLAALAAAFFFMQ